MKLIVGLGNPGKQYDTNRHNAGFIILEKIRLFFQFSEFNFQQKFLGELIISKINSQEIMLLKPITYMNLSGNSVQKVINFYKIMPENILVIQDDLDMISGKIRFKFGGKDGGHNGIKDIILKLGTDQFYRLKYGIGRPSLNHDITNYVLSNFGVDELLALEKNFDIIKNYLNTNFLN